jgi:SAM-dependent methyltransferase
MRSSTGELAVTNRPRVQWEEPGCPLCGGVQHAFVLEAPDRISPEGLWFAVVRCQDCGLCFTNPRPTAPSMAQFYPPDYRPHRAPGHCRRTLWRRLAFWRRPRQSFPDMGRPGRLLDFGCGGGSFLQQMHALGWRVVGLDTAADVVRRIRNELGLEALVGTLPHPDLAPEQFDAITMWHALEHVHAPLEVLRAARRLLVPGGRLIVEVPNFACLPARWFGALWCGLDLPRHLTHFSPQTLRLMLELAGFRPGPPRMVTHSSWVRHSADAHWKGSDARSWRRWLRNRPVARLASWYSRVTQQADSIQVIAER